MVARTQPPGIVSVYIVQALAAFDSPWEVVIAVKAQFGLELTRQGVEAYDPTKRAGRRLNSSLRDVFWAARERCKADIASIGIAHRKVRLTRLGRIAEEARLQGNVRLEARVLEQAARELSRSA